MEIVSANYLITMDGPILPNGALVVHQGEIIDVGPEKELLARYPEALYETHTHHVIMPGLINAHTHLDMTHHRDFPLDPVRSLAISPNFIDWLISCLDYKKKSSAEKLRQAIEEGIDASLENGTTCVGDMGSYEGIFQVLEEKGLRAVVFPEMISFDAAVAKDMYETAMALLEKYIDLDSELISVGAGPYSPYTLSRNILRIMAQYCRGSQIPLMMHVAESFSEMEFFYNSTGDIAEKLFPIIGWGESLPPAFQKTPLEYLEGIGFLQAEPLVVGVVHATPADLDRLAHAKAKVICTPRSNNYLKVGESPLLKMHQKGILVALGTDGISSTNTLSLWDEMRFAQKQWEGLSAFDWLSMVTSRAAKVLGLDSEIGTLAIGKQADYLVVALEDDPPLDHVYDSLIRNTRNYHVHKVVIAGRVVKNIN